MSISLFVVGCYEGDRDMTDSGRSSAEGSVSDSGSEGASSGSSEGIPNIECEPTTEGLRTAIFEPTCNRMGCHDAGAAGGLDLSVADLESVLVGAPSGTCDGKTLVVPGDPAGSFLFEKLSGMPTCGTPMPVGPALAPELVDCVGEWIEGVMSTCEMCGTQTCVDLATDPAHCGDCTTVCPAGIACVDGACACPAGTELCAGECVNTQTSPAHCGGCDMPCDDGTFCLAGVCSADCGELMACDGACVDPTSDPQHCGDCTTACSADETCVASVCACESADLSYAADIEPILAADCTNMGCHGGVVPAEGLDLRVGHGYADLVDVASGQCGDRMRVAPGEPGDSYLLDKLRGVNLCFGTKMPKMGVGPSAAEIDMISQWICAGANP